jgi:hypothetical protein
MASVGSVDVRARRVLNLSPFLRVRRAGTYPNLHMASRRKQLRFCLLRAGARHQDTQSRPGLHHGHLHSDAERASTWMLGGRGFEFGVRQRASSLPPWLRHQQQVTGRCPHPGLPLPRSRRFARAGGARLHENGMSSSCLQVPQSRKTRNARHERQRGACRRHRAVGWLRDIGALHQYRRADGVQRGPCLRPTQSGRQRQAPEISHSGIPKVSEWDLLSRRAIRRTDLGLGFFAPFR